jgi:hypothetical protein
MAAFRQARDTDLLNFRVPDFGGQVEQVELVGNEPLMIGSAASLFAAKNESEGFRRRR